VIGKFLNANVTWKQNCFSCELAHTINKLQFYVIFQIPGRRSETRIFRKIICQAGFQALKCSKILQKMIASCMQQNICSETGPGAQNSCQSPDQIWNFWCECHLLEISMFSGRQILGKWKKWFLIRTLSWRREIAGKVWIPGQIQIRSPREMMASLWSAWRFSAPRFFTSGKREMLIR
jgi:hypothetical protein